MFYRTIVPMRRVALAVVMLLLGFTTSGLAVFVAPEQCDFIETRETDERDCPPICVTCGCCAQATEATVSIAVAEVELAVSEFVTTIPRLLKAEPQDVLHVPRPVDL
jgi:hypothetical protein